MLILIPGFAGGSHSFKIWRRTDLASASAAATSRLEVWAFDRRTDQLEDGAGGELAETEARSDLAINWYFGNELGLPLDPRISAARRVPPGSDVPFIANWTHNVFTHDIDAVVDAAARDARLAQGFPGRPLARHAHSPRAMPPPT